MDWITIALWLTGTLIAILGPIIAIHEIGHFVFAKLTGVRVEEFGLGFPPRLLKLWRGRGFLRIHDVRVLIPANYRLLKEVEKGKFVEAAVQQRSDGAYILQHLTMLDPERASQQSADQARLRGQVTEIEPGTIYSLNLLPMGAFVKMTGEEDPSDPRSLAAQPKRRRLAVMAAGPLLNIIAAFILITAAYASGVTNQWFAHIIAVEPQGAAAEAGVQVGDIVMAADGQRITEGPAQLREIIRSSSGRPVELSILRQEETFIITAMPQLVEENGETHGVLGITMEIWPDKTAMRRYSISHSLGAGVSELGRAFLALVRLPGRILQGDVEPQDARPISMVGASQLLTFSLQRSIAWKMAFPALQTAALISLALGLTNLLPIPALDGGRMLFVLVEAIRGRRIAPEREAAVHFVAMTVLLILMTFVMLYDVIMPIIPWSWVK